jgi:hypothetical protein
MLQGYSLHDTTRRQKIEINEPASIHRLFQNRFKGAYGCSGFCLIRKIVPKYSTTVDEAPQFPNSFFGLGSAKSVSVFLTKRFF